MNIVHREASSKCSGPNLEIRYFSVTVKPVKPLLCSASTPFVVSTSDMD